MSSAETAPVISCSGLLLSVLQIEASETETKSPLEKKKKRKKDTESTLEKQWKGDGHKNTHTHRKGKRVRLTATLDDGFHSAPRPIIATEAVWPFPPAHPLRKKGTQTAIGSFHRWWIIRSTIAILIRIVLDFSPLFFFVVLRAFTKLCLNKAILRKFNDTDEKNWKNWKT